MADLATSSADERQSLVLPDPALLMKAFVSLGDNCEFGMVQRYCGAEPLDIFRFNWTDFDHLVRGIEASLSDVGDIENMHLEWVGDEIIVEERLYGFKYHTFITDRSTDIERERRKQSRHLKYLSRKFMEDLVESERIFVRKGERAMDDEASRRLLQAMRRHGPAILLVVQTANAENTAETVVDAGDGLLKGYVDRLADYAEATKVSLISWLALCRNAYALVKLGRVPEPRFQHQAVNLIEASNGFGGWCGSGRATSERIWTVVPHSPDAAVMRHTLVGKTVSGQHDVFGWLHDRLTDAASTYLVACSIWIPQAFEGSSISLGCVGWPTFAACEADLAMRDQWQTIWTRAVRPTETSTIFVQLYVLGTRSDWILSSGWRVESTNI